MKKIGILVFVSLQIGLALNSHALTLKYKAPPRTFGAKIGTAVHGGLPFSRQTWVQKDAAGNFMLVEPISNFNKGIDRQIRIERQEIVDQVFELAESTILVKKVGEEIHFIAIDNFKHPSPQQVAYEHNPWHGSSAVVTERSTRVFNEFSQLIKSLEESGQIRILRNQEGDSYTHSTQVDEGNYYHFFTLAAEQVK